MKDIQAFPLHNTHAPTYDQVGMTLRDYFAGQALRTSEKMGTSPKESAEIAYNIADAMLAQREEGK